MFETTWISAILRIFFGRFDGLELWAGRCFDQKKTWNFVAPRCLKKISRCWLNHPSETYLSNWIISPRIGVKTKHKIWNHRLEKQRKSRKRRKHTGLSVDLEVKPSPASPFKVCCSHDVFSVHRSAGCRGCHSWPAGFFFKSVGRESRKNTRNKSSGSKWTPPLQWHFHQFQVNISKFEMNKWPSYLSTWCPFRDHQLGVPIVKRFRKVLRYNGEISSPILERNILATGLSTMNCIEVDF